jgi:mutator protein MutT
LINKKVIKDVCGALIERDGEFIIARRKPDDTFGGLWEFPGGSIEPGEDREECLKREIKEELGVDIEVGRLIYTFADEIPSLKINVFLFECKIKKGIPRPIDCQEVRWADLVRLKRLKLAQADKKVLNWIINRQNGNQGKAKG